MTTKTTTTIGLLLLLVAGCRFPDTFGIGYVRGSLDGSTSATIPGFSGDVTSDTDDRFRGNTDLEADAIMLFAGWSLGYTQAKRNGERLERMERALQVLRLELCSQRSQATLQPSVSESP